MAEALFDAISSAANLADYSLQLGWNLFNTAVESLVSRGIKPPMQQKVGIRKLINMVNHPHPDVYSAVEILKREQKQLNYASCSWPMEQLHQLKKESI